MKSCFSTTYITGTSKALFEKQMNYCIHESKIIVKRRLKVLGCQAENALLEFIFLICVAFIQ